jgi:hypothetical protein
LILKRKLVVSLSHQSPNLPSHPVSTTVTVVELRPGRVLVLGTGTGAPQVVDVNTNQNDDLMLPRISQLLELGDKHIVRTTMLEHMAHMTRRLTEHLALSGHPGELSSKRYEFSESRTMH